MSKYPFVNVGIMSSSRISFRLDGSYKLNETEKIYSGEFSISLKDNKIEFKGNLFDKLSFSPVNYTTDSFCLNNVSIGIDFHWEREESQSFQGYLNLIIQDNVIIAINKITIEDYILSVISSEMKATSSIELLKAHAVISRSWLLAQINKNKKTVLNSYQTKDNEIIRWYDKEDHVLFDVCADDHCQRYQGITKISTETVKNAVEQTSGKVLVYKDEICDTRFSKCCGGITEEYETCWEPKHVSYLESVNCFSNKINTEDKEIYNLSIEDWILTNPQTFCNTNNKSVLSQVLNNYDQETNDFFRWEINYTQSELANLICKKTNIDFGSIIDLIPEERGKSGRIKRLHIIGTKTDFFIGKELEIRRILSESHLYSSAFVILKENIKEGIPERFTLKGAGWGHGVGLCQIGAAVMAEKGYNYKEILAHYYKNTSLSQLYNNKM